ncbi:hypothetical protein A2690_02700 [Candidatus Roizmanbacteria bacterium RIFCSPHIGHO2_01_FULL_39_12b]|uniref:CBS domain-containing protein n=1 Tax=Candidatus Roizmanbacteria bacterium RIFCSPHIGHO2_01_FULL_39_12b TaxID=1802030 RepID=A0A1F7GCF6_9BACT|nr:MAG: hypothetical protein A2690_02700 [Candidatus Roizmanbacteria bacterium RIFCSPHIGHO2_01_FULL_39_12b]
MTVGDIYKTSGIIKVSPNDTISGVLSKLTSSHDTAFVFDPSTGSGQVLRPRSGQGKFLGIIVPFFSTIKKTHDPATKVDKMLVHPPRVGLNDSLEHVAKLMTESKMHYLPVFEHNEFKGIINARRILSAILDKVDNFKQVVSLTHGKHSRLVSITVEDSIMSALHLFKEHNISKLVVVSPDMKLKGILAQYDLMGYFTVPKDRQTFGAFEGEKVKQHNALVKNLYKTNVLTMTIHNTYERAFQLMNDKNLGSVVVIDHDNHPIKIVTTGDLLRMLIEKKKELPIDLSVRRIQESDKKKTDYFVNQLSRRLKHLDNLSKVTVSIDEHKNGKAIEVTLRLSYLRNKDTIIKKTGKNIQNVLAKVITTIDSYISKL